MNKNLDVVEVIKQNITDNQYITLMDSLMIGCTILRTVSGILRTHRGRRGSGLGGSSCLRHLRRAGQARPGWILPPMPCAASLLAPVAQLFAPVAQLFAPVAHLSLTWLASGSAH